jgi:hypothetical protein
MSTSSVNLLSLEPGNLPLEVFNAIAHITVTPVIELVITDGRAVLLRRRPNTDQYWPGQYCLPGSIVYSGGPKSFDGYVSKILKGLNIGITTKPQLVDIGLYTTRRGDEVAIIYRLDLEHHSDAPLGDNAQFIQVSDLSDINIINEHLEILQGFLSKVIDD